MKARETCKRVFIGGLLLSILAPTSSASPRKVLAKTAHFFANHVTLDAFAMGSSGLSAYGTIRCRGRNGPEPCADHYGAYKQGIAADAVLTFTMISLGEYGRKAGFKEWFVPTLAVTAGNTAFAVRQWRTKKREADK